MIFGSLVLVEVLGFGVLIMCVQVAMRFAFPVVFMEVVRNWVIDMLAWLLSLEAQLEGISLVLWNFYFGRSESVASDGQCEVGFRFWTLGNEMFNFMWKGLAESNFGLRFLVHGTG